MKRACELECRRIACMNIRYDVQSLIRMMKTFEAMEEVEFVGEIVHEQIRADLGHDDEGGRIGMLFDRAIMK